VRLKDVFVELLKNKGIDRIGTSISKIIKSDDPIQKMAVYLTCKKASVCCAKKKLKYSFDLNGNTVIAPPQVYFGKCGGNVILTAEELLSNAKKVGFPYILIDCSFYDLHSKKEKKSLLIQIRETLNVVRRFMWDERLIVTLNCGIGVYYPSTPEFIKKKRVKKVVLLDPNAGKEFDEKKAECYIIGGIVDKSGNKRGLTSKIGEMLEKEGINFESRKILLKGDITGVPDRLNTIAEIVLRVVLDGENVDTAIKKVQKPIIARKRLAKELPKIATRVDVGKAFRVVCKSDFEKFDWLNLRKEDFYKVCSQINHIVVSDNVMDEIRRCRWDEKRERYVLNLN